MKLISVVPRGYCQGVVRAIMTAEKTVKEHPDTPIYMLGMIVHNRFVVAECKRPEITLDAGVLEQAMRYNSVLGVRFLAVTNGNLTYLYRLEGETFVPCGHIPDYEEMLCQR